MITISPRSRQPVREPWTLDHLVHARAVALGCSIDISTAATYTSHLQSYLTFCKIHHMPVEPTVDTLSFFTVYMCHHIRPSSVDSYLSGICNQLEGRFPAVRQARRHYLVAKTLAGCKHMFGQPSSRKDPLEIDHLRDALRAFPPISHDNLLFTILLLCGFFALHRLGELVWPDAVKLRDSRKLIWRASVRWFTSGFGYTLPSSKTDHVFEGSRIIYSSTNAPPDLDALTYERED